MDELTETDKRNLELLEHLRTSQGESDRGLVLFSAAQIDLYLTRLLEAFLIDDPSIKEMFEAPFAPFSTLSARTKAAFAMGLISRAEARRIDAIRKVRNIFAHQIDASFEHEGVKKLCDKEPIHDDRQTDRDAFLHLALNTVPLLMYRDIQVRTEWKRAEYLDVADDGGQE